MARQRHLSSMTLSCGCWLRQRRFRVPGGARLDHLPHIDDVRPTRAPTHVPNPMSMRSSSPFNRLTGGDGSELGRSDKIILIQSIVSPSTSSRCSLSLHDGPRHSVSSPPFPPRSHSSPLSCRHVSAHEHPRKRSRPTPAVRTLRHAPLRIQELAPPFRSCRVHVVFQSNASIERTLPPHSHRHDTHARPFPLSYCSTPACRSGMMSALPCGCTGRGHSQDGKL